jgi:two-component system nitrate/nitrite response regulator NarL
LGHLVATCGELTAREREVLDMLGEGRRATEIAARFGLSVATVRNHIRAVLRKLECHSQLEAVAEGRRRGLLT